jgi:phage tail sheath protein FI
MTDHSVNIGVLPRPRSLIAPNAPTAVTAFIDFFSTGPIDTPTPIASFLEFEQTFGGLDSRSEASYQIQQFFNNSGQSALVFRIAPEPSSPLFASKLKSALNSLSSPFNILCIPATANLASTDMHDIMTAAQTFCVAQRAFYIADIPPSTAVASPSAMASWFGHSDLSALDCAAIYYPCLIIPDPLQQNAPREIGYSGTAAGIYAQTDSTRGVWKAPAGTNAVIAGATPSAKIDDVANGELAVLGINAIRSFQNVGTVLWGARTTAGASNSDYRYVNVRRLALYLEQSLLDGLQWVVFEPNGPALWASIRLAVDSFLIKLWQQGAFQASKAQQAFFVHCDATTTTQADINNGRVNVEIGFAPLKPAEFILLRISLNTLIH